MYVCMLFVFLQLEFKVFRIGRLLQFMLSVLIFVNGVMCHCQQLAVPCYPKNVIDDINRQISALKVEYHAFVNKLQSLEPDHSIPDHRYRSQLKRSSDGQYNMTSHIFTQISQFLQFIFITIRMAPCCGLSTGCLSGIHPAGKER